MPDSETKPNAWTLMDRAGQQEIPTGDTDQNELWVYADKFTYAPGEEVQVRVHTTAKHYELEVFRDGLESTVVHHSEQLAGEIQTTPQNAYEVGCKWPVSYVFKPGSSWEPGVYLISLRAKISGGIVETETFFVLKSHQPGSISSTVLVLATGTYVAYNDWGGANAYRQTLGGIPTDTLAPRLSLNRPWAKGLVRMPEGAPRYADSPDLPPFGHPRYPWLEWSFAYGYSRHCRDAGWATYDRPFAHWAEREGFVIEYLTQHDLHFDPQCLSPYENVILVGHDEYWTAEMRDAIDQHVDAGKNVSRFGGNFLWQIRIEDGGKTQICYKDPLEDPIFKTNKKHLTSTCWDFDFIKRPAAYTLGLTGLGGIYTRFGTAAGRASGGLTVYRPDHWAFNDTDLYYGDVFGQDPKIASFEVDGVDYTFRKGLPYPTHLDAAPDTLEILAMAPAVRGEPNHRNYLVNAPLDEFEAIVSVSRSGLNLIQHESLDHIYGAGMMAVFTRNSGTVFNSGTTEWVAGLLDNDFFVCQITRNVLRRLGRSE